MMEQNSEIKPLTFDTYLAVIENSVGSYMFKNLYISVNGEKKMRMDNGVSPHL